MKTDIKVSFTKEEDYWYDRPDVKKIDNFDNFKIIFPDLLIVPPEGGGLMYICFVNEFGIIFEYSGNYTHLIYSYPNPTSDILHYLCEGNFFSKASNAKLWYSAFKYAMQNKNCKSFWEQYQHTLDGSRFMATLLGSK